MLCTRKLYTPCFVALSISSFALAGGIGRQSLRDQLQSDFPGVSFFEQHQQLKRVWGTTFGIGNTTAEAAVTFVESYSPLWGVDPADLEAGNWFNDSLTQSVMFEADTRQPKFTLHYYRQTFDGLPVFQSELRLLVTNTNPAQLVWAGSTLKEIEDFSLSGLAWTGEEVEAYHNAIRAIYPQTTDFSEPRLIVYAGSADDAATDARLAVEFEIEGASVPGAVPHLRRLVLDAGSAEFLYDENLVTHTDIFGSVSAVVTEGWPADICAEESPRGLPYAAVFIENSGFDTYSDVNGDFVIQHLGDQPVNVVSEIRGEFFEVFDEAGDESRLVLSVTPPGPADFTHNKLNDSEYIRAQMNAYLHANIVRDYALAQNPNYPTIWDEREFRVNVNQSGSCNAFYNQTAINFYRAGGGCPNMAFATVVHHEYGHHLVRTGGSGQGAYGEGMSDTTGVIITDEPGTGVGFFGDCDEPLRSAENNVQYPCSGGIHDCGRLLSGSVWETRNELLITSPDTYREIISSLTINSILLHSGSNIDPTITIDFLTLDDDDGDLGNGSPHYYEIAAGFGEHSMDAPPLDALRLDAPDGVPNMLLPTGGNTFRVTVLPIGRQPKPNSGLLHVRSGDGDWQQVSMQPIGDLEYLATFPATSCGKSALFYVTVEDETDTQNSYPKNAPHGNFRAFSMKQTDPVFADNFENDNGWQVKNMRGLVSGAWERAVPGNFGNQDPPADYDASGMCFVTENRKNRNVDNGYTQITSPLIDASADDMLVTYARWFYSSDTDSKGDKLVVRLSNDDGATWMDVETVPSDSNESKGGWLVSGFRIADFVEPTDRMRVMFYTADFNEVTLVEAGLDAFAVSPLDCSPPTIGDTDCDGEIGFGDIDGFVVALVNPIEYALTYPNCVYTVADINQDGNVDLDDIDPFIECVILGECP
jgi:hypothetical protein